LYFGVTLYWISQWKENPTAFWWNRSHRVWRWSRNRQERRKHGWCKLVSSREHLCVLLLFWHSSVF